MHPLIARELHPTKNGEIDSASISRSDKRRLWWRCSKNREHEWQTKVSNRTWLGNGCPMCSGRVATPSTSLAAFHPGIAAEWHPTKNAPLGPRDVRPGSHKKVWWRCPVSTRHIWQAQVKARVRGSGCRFCAGFQAGTLASRHPAIAADLHPARNGELTAEALAPNSSKVVCWQCSVCAHEWTSAVNARTRLGYGCAACAGRVATPVRSLAGLYPALAREWLAARNTGLRAAEVLPGSKRKVWWRCAQASSHVWQATVVKRARYQQGCPMCSHHVVTPKTSLARTYPKIAREWHPLHNGALDPSAVVPGSNRRVWWRCSKDATHEFRAMIVQRTKLSTGCPFCTGQRATPSTSFSATFPELLWSWHPEMNESVLPSTVMPHSKQRVWWRCRKSPLHLWLASVDAMTRPATRASRTGGCPFCRGLLVPAADSVAAMPALLKEWHPRKNEETSPWLLSPKSKRVVWWRCGRAHDWAAPIRSRPKRTCPICTKEAVAQARRKRPAAGRARSS